MINQMVPFLINSGDPQLSFPAQTKKKCLIAATLSFRSSSARYFTNLLYFPKEEKLARVFTEWIPRIFLRIPNKNRGLYGNRDSTVLSSVQFCRKNTQLAGITLIILILKKLQSFDDVAGVRIFFSAAS